MKPWESGKPKSKSKLESRPKHNSTYLIRPLKVENLPYAWNLTQQEQWGLVFEELSDLFHCYSGGKFICIHGDKPLATIFGTAYDTMGFIGNLIVDSNFRNQGIGTRLLQHLLNYFHQHNISPVMLDAVERAAPLYRTLGFQEVCRSLRYRGILPVPTTSKPDRMHPMTEVVWKELMEFDKQHFGGNRESLLLPIFQKYPQLCFYLTHKGKISGYIMAIERNGYYKIGPWMVDLDEPEPDLLLRHFFSPNASHEIYLGVLEQNIRTVKIMEDLQIPCIFSSIRMILGSPHPDPSPIMALAGPDRG
ncbi:MAG: GNAT family N-acetyltransferase [Promethearchaeota archaeon]